MTTPRCAMTLEKISAYLDGELDVSKCAVIERHCETCAACRALVAGFRDTMGLCQKAGRAPVPASVRERARRQVRELLAAQSRQPSSVPPVSPASAGADVSRPASSSARSGPGRRVRSERVPRERASSRAPVDRRSRRPR